ncbi:MAG: hypothetical protein HYS22_05395 [Deltaproteobacteria bacterium]|nr:hypothetical protein [Deltaproteobacteria bacterium]
MAKGGKTRPITPAEATALRTATADFFRRAGREPDRSPSPGQGEKRQPLTRVMLAHAHTALDFLAAGRTGEMAPEQKRDLQALLDRLSGSDEITRNPAAANALRRANEALRTLTDPTRRTVAAPAVQSLPRFLERPELPGEESSPDELYQYRVRDAWRSILRDLLQFPSQELIDHAVVFGTGNPEKGAVEFNWLLFADGDRKFYLQAEYLDGRLWEITVRWGQPSNNSLRFPTDYASSRGIENTVVSFFNTLHFSRNPLPQLPTAPSRRQVFWSETASFFTAGFSGPTVSVRFTREMGAYKDALGRARIVARNGPVPSLYFSPKKSAGTVPSIPPTPAASGGTTPPPASPGSSASARSIGPDELDLAYPADRWSRFADSVPPDQIALLRAEGIELDHAELLLREVVRALRTIGR